jgi:hypothetical protein
LPAYVKITNSTSGQSATIPYLSRTSGVATLS